MHKLCAAYERLQFDMGKFEENEEAVFSSLFFERFTLTGNLKLYDLLF